MFKNFLVFRKLSGSQKILPLRFDKIMFDLKNNIIEDIKLNIPAMFPSIAIGSIQHVPAISYIYGHEVKTPIKPLVQSSGA